MKETPARPMDGLAITVFLAALVLAGIWFWERHQANRLEEANVAAQDYSRDALPAGCDAFAAGPGGRTLVIRCEGQSLEQMKNALDPKRASAFDSFFLVDGSGESVRCDREAELRCEPATSY